MSSWAEKKRILFGLSATLFSELVNRVLPLVVALYVIRLLGAEAYGQSQFSIQIMDVALVLSTLGFRFSGMYHYNQAEDKSQFLTSIFVSRLIVAIVMTSVALAWCWLTRPQYFSMCLVIAAVPLSVPFDLSFALFAQQRLVGMQFMVSVIKIVALILTLFLVRGPDDVHVFLFLSYGINSIISLGIYLMLRPRLVLKNYSLKNMVEVLRMNSPYLLCVACFLIFEKVEYFSIESTYTAHELGLYSTAYRVSVSLLSLLIALSGVFLAEASRPGIDLKLNLSRGVRILLLVYMPVAFCIAAYQQQILVFLFSDEFLDSPLLILILGVLPLSVITVIGEQYFMALKDFGSYIRVLTLGGGLLLLMSSIPGWSFEYRLLAFLMVKLGLMVIMIVWYQTWFIFSFFDSLIDFVPALSMWGVYYLIPANMPVYFSCGILIVVYGSTYVLLRVKGSTLT